MAATPEAVVEGILAMVQSGDKNRMRQAETDVKALEQSNFPLYLYLLAQYMASVQKPLDNRVLAGVLFRQTLFSKDPEERGLKAQRWLALPNDARSQIKPLFLQTMTDQVNPKARNTAAQVVARIALVELPHGQWRELIPMLMNNMTNMQIPGHIKQATLDAIGLILEEIDAKVLAEAADEMLTAIIQGMRPDQKDPTVKLSACKALFAALNFAERNFDDPQECEVIMNTVLDAAANAESLDIAVAAYAVLNEIAYLHYDKLAPSMQKIFKLTLTHISGNNEDVAKQAIEFWCTIADHENKLLSDISYAAQNQMPPPSQKPLFFTKGAAQYLLPVLTGVLTKQTNPDVDPDEWTVTMAAGACIQLAATTVRHSLLAAAFHDRFSIGDDIVPHVLPFIEQNIRSQQWAFREAAILTFGSILEGPRNITQLIVQATPMLLEHMKDKMPAIKDTTAWTLGRIVQMHHKAIYGLAETILGVMVNALDDDPRVSANACYCIHNIAISFEEEENNPLARHFQQTVQKLLVTSARDDSDEFHLRTAAYESLNVVLSTCPPEVMGALEQVIVLVLQKLESTHDIQIVSQDDANDQAELQGLLCGVVQVITNKVGAAIAPYADRIMVNVLRLFATKRDTNVHEEAFLTVAALANAVEKNFLKYMQDFHPFLYNGLGNWKEHEVCNVAVGIVGDVARAVGNDLLPFCDRIITLLLQDLQNRSLDRAVKPSILSCFGDVALAIGGNFDKYLEVVMGMLRQAAQTVMKTPYFDSEDYDLVDYMNALREGILEAYTGIIQGLRADKKSGLIFPHINPIMQLIAHVQADPRRSEACARTAVGIIGDLILGLGSRVRPAVSQPFVAQLVQATYQLATTDETKETAEFTGSLLKKI